MSFVSNSPYSTRKVQQKMNNGNINRGYTTSSNIVNSPHGKSIKKSFSNRQRELQIEQLLHSQNDLKVKSFREHLNNLTDLQLIQFEDNSKYYGQIVDDSIRQGIGIFQTQQGEMYLGDWQDDKYHGYGLYIYQDGSRYEGDLVENLKQGKGKYFYKDGRVYQGDWVDDQREGEGIQINRTKCVKYVGNWQNDKKQGQGRLFLLIDNNQNPLLDGMWSNDKFVEGFVNSETYQGQFKNQTLCGQGVYRLPDGSVYRGQFMNNIFNGKGIYYYPNGDVYEGSFLTGLKSGFGIYRYFTGDIYEGNYSKDLKSGEGKFSFINGNYYIGQFERDSFHGKGKYFFNKEESVSGFWQHGNLSKDDRGQIVGNQRKNIIGINTAERDFINSSERGQLRDKSPQNYNSSLQNIDSYRNVSPFNSRMNKSTNNIESNIYSNGSGQSGIHERNINPLKSAIKDSKFMDMHTSFLNLNKSSLQKGLNSGDKQQQKQTQRVLQNKQQNWPNRYINQNSQFQQQRNRHQPNVIKQMNVQQSYLFGLVSSRGVDKSINHQEPQNESNLEMNEINTEYRQNQAKQQKQSKKKPKKKLQY